MFSIDDIAPETRALIYSKAVEAVGAILGFLSSRINRINPIEKQHILALTTLLETTYVEGVRDAEQGKQESRSRGGARVVAPKKPKTPKFKLAGKHAWLRDICCAPKQTGSCTIIAASSHGPEWVVVKWAADGHYHSEGDVSCIKLSELEIR
jgi:hypothetical protein